MIDKVKELIEKIDLTFKMLDAIVKDMHKQNKLSDSTDASLLSIFHADIGEVDVALLLTDCKVELERLQKENEKFKEALKDIGYCKTWTAQNNGMSLVKIALTALRQPPEGV